MGFPFNGILLKDLILEVAYGKYTSIGYFSYCLGTGSLFYSFYSVEFTLLLCRNHPVIVKLFVSYDSGINITFALGCLAIPSIL
jgi:hypothetical protein